MGKFSDRVDDIKSQTDMLRSSLTKATGIDSTGYSIGKCAKAIDTRLSNGLDLTESTATEEDVREGKTFWSKTNEIKTGTLKLDSLVVDLGKPDKFVPKTAVVYFKVDDNTVLISSSGTAVGLIEYNATTGEIKTLCDKSRFTVFQKINNTQCLIGSDSSGAGIMLYDTMTHSVKQISTLDYLGQFDKVGESWLLSATSGANGVHRYDSETETLIPVQTGSYYRVKYTTDNKCFISGTAATSVYLYDDSDKSVKPIHTRSTGTNGFVYFHSIGSKVIASTNSSSTELMVYDFATDSTTLLTAPKTGSYLYSFAYNDDELLLTASASIIVYNALDDSVVSVYTTSTTNAQYFHKIQDRVLVGRYNYESLIIVNMTTKTAGSRTLYQKSPRYFHNVSETRVLISSPSVSTSVSGSPCGIYVYDVSDNSLERIYQYDTGWSRFLDIPGGCYVANSGTIMIYSLIANSVTQKIASIGVLGQFVPDEESGGGSITSIPASASAIQKTLFCDKDGNITLQNLQLKGI